MSSGVLAPKLPFGSPVVENTLGAKGVLQNIRESSRVFQVFVFKEWLENSGRKLLRFLNKVYAI